ncbi:hypothetical protein [Candidatus Nitrosocosmicus franklandus]|uniref:hypothetical protein n=1 Tax=Candidatus Nitrosocosmicus franklandianus TaxID=1798806 RepID=UPI00106A6E8D|nr:hypothetical protein [Candidatus Nitrosocosmicus franklandus]
MLIVSTVGLLSNFDTDLLAQTPSPEPDVGEQFAISLDPTDSIYNHTKVTHLGSKNISSSPYLVPEDRYIDEAIIKGVGNVTNNQTYIGTHLSGELIQGTGHGTITTQDGESIDWIVSGIGKPYDNGGWFFYDIMLFNSTQSESLAFLNNNIGLFKSLAGDEPDSLWLLG